MDNQELDKQLLLLVHTLRPHEKITIKADEYGNPESIVILTERKTILKYEATYTQDQKQ